MRDPPCPIGRSHVKITCTGAWQTLLSAFNSRITDTDPALQPLLRTAREWPVPRTFDSNASLACVSVALASVRR